MRTESSFGLEADLQELDAAIAQGDADVATKDEQLTKLIAGYKDKGVNPLTDTEAFEQVELAGKDVDGDREQVAELRRRRQVVGERLAGRSPRKGGDGAKVIEDVVERFMATPRYRELLESGAFAAQGTHIDIPGIEVATREAVLRGIRGGRGVFAATADIEDFVPVDQRLFPPVDIPVRQVRVTDMVTVSTTDSDQVNYVEETTRTDAAAETAPGTAANEATYAYTERSAFVRDITHFTPAHKRNLADAGQTRALLEGRLTSGVQRRLESEIIQGDGVDPNLRGILDPGVGIGSVTFGSAGHTDENVLDAIHRGITTVRIALEDDIDAIGVHPTQYEHLVLAKDDQDRYLMGDAAQRTTRTIWGYPAAVTTAFPDDQALVGNYKAGAVLWLRSGVTLSASDSHEDFFTRRMVALMAELRAAFATWQPRAFCAVGLDES